MDYLDTFKYNLKELSEIYSQRKIAEDCGISPASINNYLNKNIEPSVFFLMGLRDAYKIDIDAFLTKKVVHHKADDIDLIKDTRFYGNYIIYYYDASVYKGRVNYDKNNTLSYGVISILSEKDSAGIMALGLFNLSRAKAHAYLNKLKEIRWNREILSFYDDEKEKKYEGRLQYSNSHIFFNFSNEDANDKCLIIMNNPPSSKAYLGGMGTVNSVSRGREHMPCVQYMIVSKNELNVPDGELYNLLALGLSDVDLNNETNQLIKLFKDLYDENIELSRGLSEIQKKKIIENMLASMIAEVNDVNMFRFAKVSEMEDDKYYRLIKENNGNVE